MKIIGINGSLRKASINGALLRATFELVGARAATSLVDIGALPHYNSDLDGDTLADKPEAVARLIAAITDADALVIATPEYNYSLPGVLKNAIDWVSRPAYRSPLAGKPTGILGASMSPVGTARAQAALRQCLAGTVTPVFPYPEFLAGAAHTKFDGDGTLTDDTTRKFLTDYVEGFLAWSVRS